MSSRPRSAAHPLLLAALAAVLLAPGASAKRPEPVLVLGGHDPVALAEGREARGREDVVADHGRYRYRFEGPASRARFLADPARWAVQNGGGCGKMGPLSGLGSPERWLVHEGRTYLFASETCRDRFRSDPARFVEAPDPVPASDPALDARGRALLERAAEGFGGAKAVDGLRGLLVTVRADYAGRDTVHTAVRTHLWSFPGRYRYEERWGEKPYGHALDGEAAMDVSGEFELPAEPAVRDYIVRDYWRHPIALVRERRSGGMVVRWAGRDTVAGAPVEIVETAIGGATTSLAIEPATGRVLQARFRGRTANGYAPMTHTYGDFRPAGGIVWPFAVAVGYDGAPLRSPRLAVTEVRPDPEVDAARFRPAN